MRRALVAWVAVMVTTSLPAWAEMLPPVPVRPPLTAARARQADAMARAFEEEKRAGRLSFPAAQEPSGSENLDLTLALVARGGDADLVAESLRLMDRALSERPIGNSDGVTPLLQRHPEIGVVISARLASKNRSVLTEAFRVASALNRGRQPNAPSLTAITTRVRTGEDVAIRLSALDAVETVGMVVFFDAPEVASTLLGALADPEPAVVVKALLLLQTGVRSQRFLSRLDRNALEGTVAGLRAHSVPAIRLSAIGVTAMLHAQSPVAALNVPSATGGPLAAQRDKALGDLERLLGDPVSAVRAQAAVAIGQVQDLRAAPRLGQLLTDRGSSNLEVPDWPVPLRVEGRKAPLKLMTVLEEPAQVNHAVVKALSALSMRFAADPSQVLMCESPETALAKCTQDAAAWIARNRARFR